jgi:hypothetical protein
MQQAFLFNSFLGARRRGWFTLLWLLVFGPAAVAQTATIGSTTVPAATPATASYLYGPIYRSANDAGSTFNYSRYAHLYTAAELNLPTGSVITQLAWLKNDAGEVTGNNNFDVYLENSALTTLGTTQPWNTLTATATQAYTSTTQQVTGGAGAYFSVTLNAPFVYTGGNLLLLTDWTKLGSASAAVNFVTNLATGFGLGAANSIALTPTTALTSASYGNRRPTLRITYAPGGPCTAPPTAGTTMASATSVCAGSSVNLTLQGASYGQGQTYQWQESTNGGTSFTDITGATGFSYSTPALSSTRTYRARLTCTGQSANSTPVTVTVAAPTYATLPVAESFENAWVNACDTRDVPSNSWRNNPATSNSSWRRDDDATAASWVNPTLGVYTPTGSQGTRSARFHSYSAGAGGVGNLDLYVNLSASGNKVLQFDYLNTAGNDSLFIEVSTNGGTSFGAPLLKLGNSGTVAQGWTAQNVSIVSTSATTIVRFRTKVTATATSDIGLDNVRLDILSGIPSCATNFSPANGTTNVARATTLTWQSGSGVTTGYDVYFGTSTTPPLVSANQTGTSYTAAGLLAANTTYYYQIVARNANGPAVGCAVQSFTTNSVPVYCNPGTIFLSGFCGANNVTDVTIAGSGLNATGLSCNTVTTSFGTSAYTAYPNTGSTTGTLLQGLTYPITVNTNGSSILSVWVDFNQNGVFEASEHTQIATSSTANQAVTVSFTVPANATLGLTGLRVRSRGTGNANGPTDACTTMGGGETKDFVVTIGAAPSCAPAAGLAAGNITTTGATLSFTTPTNGTATNYIVQYGPAGFTPGGANSTTVNSSSTSVNISGLTANTNYQFYVTKDCGGGQLSQVAGPFSFRTACVAPSYATLPVLESFESTWVDICDTHDAPNAFWRTSPATGNTSWRRDDDGTTAAWTSPTVGVYTPAGSQGTRSARFHSYYAGAAGVGLLDLYVNLSAAGGKRLSFDYLNTAGNDSLFVQVSTDGGATFGPALARLGISGTVAQAWMPQSLTLSSTSATTVVRFRTKVTTTFTSDIGLDNVRLESLNGCLAPAALTATTTATTAALAWVTGGSGTYTIEYGPTGFTPGTGTIVSGLTASPYNVSGLTPGTAYQFYVTQNCAGGTNSGTAGPVAFLTTPANDDCAGAINVPVQYGTCVAQTSADNTAATNSAGVPAPTCANYLEKDIWFKVTVPASGAVTIQTLPPTAGSSVIDTGMSIYSGTCGNLTQVGCDDDSNPTGAYSLLDLTGRTPGEVLYIRVWEYGGGTTGLIAVCVTSPSNCAVPVAPVADNLSNTTADLSWTISGAPTPGATFEIEYGLQASRLALVRPSLV